MKSYKLKQSIVVTETGAVVMAKVIKSGTTIYGKSNFYEVPEEKKEGL